jgi:hypothetical protein
MDDGGTDLHPMDIVCYKCALANKGNRKMKRSIVFPDARAYELSLGFKSAFLCLGFL